MDDEVKGKGNSINYKYRMHDPRIGRFFAVDPLAPKYPHNSPYAFSENSTIAFIELEGLERYYTADGRNLGQIGTDDQVRVVNSSYTDEQLDEMFAYYNNSQKYPDSDINGLIGEISSLLESNSVKLSKAGKMAQKNVIKAIYLDVDEGKAPINGVKVGDAVHGEAANMNEYRNKILEVQTSVIVFGLSTDVFSLFDNYFDIANILFHERTHLHWYNKTGYTYSQNSMDHFLILQEQVEHWSFDRMTPTGQAYVKQVAIGYLDGMKSALEYAISGSNGAKEYKSKKWQDGLKRYKESIEFFNEHLGDASEHKHDANIPNSHWEFFIKKE